MNPFNGIERVRVRLWKIPDLTIVRIHSMELKVIFGHVACY